MKCYGEDYTSDNVYRNGQHIYPYFMITSISKGTKDMYIECIQMHNLKRNNDILSSASGDFLRNGNVNQNNLDAFGNYLLYPTQYLTEGQKYSCDVNFDNVIDWNDHSLITELLDIETEDDTSDDDIDEPALDDIVAPYPNKLPKPSSFIIILPDGCDLSVNLKLLGFILWP